MNGILLDQGLAPAAAEMLREYGFDAIHVSEIGMDRSDDVDILQRARGDGRVCITLDHDFHRHLALTGEGQPSVVLLRIQGINARSQADLIRVVCSCCGDALMAGAAVSTDGETIRVRRLPLGSVNPPRS